MRLIMFFSLLFISMQSLAIERAEEFFHIRMENRLGKKAVETIAKAFLKVQRKAIYDACPLSNDTLDIVSDYLRPSEKYLESVALEDDIDFLLLLNIIRWIPPKPSNEKRKVEKFRAHDEEKEAFFQFWPNDRIGMELNCYFGAYFPFIQ